MHQVFSAQAQLGEGALWDADHQRLLWVDIVGHRVHRYDPVSGIDQSIDVGNYVGSMVPARGGGLILTLLRSFYHLDWETQELRLLASVESDRPTNRFNDGKCDPRGRFWAGTLELAESKPAGALYCLEPDLTVRKVLSGITVSNGLDWSPDGSTMYYIDSATRAVTAFDYDLDHGTLSHRRQIIHLTDGVPDGMTVDSEGMIWIAHWDGYRISRWNPAQGARLQTFELPVARITSIAIGGSDLRQLFVTSARHGLSAADLRAQPLAGDLFSARTEIQGLPARLFG